MKRFVLTVLILMFATGAFAETDTSRIGSLYMNGLTEDSLGILDGDTGESYALFDNLSTMLLALEAGKIDFASLPECAADYVALRNDNLAVTPADPPMSVVYRMAVAETNTELLDKLNSAIEALAADGTLDNIINECVTNIDVNYEPEIIKMPEIEGAETVRVVVTGDLPPFDYTLSDATPAGFNVRLLIEISKKANLNIELVSADSAARATMLAMGRADAIFWVSSHVIVDENENIVREKSEAIEGVIMTDSYAQFPAARLSVKRN